MMTRVMAVLLAVALILIPVAAPIAFAQDDRETYNMGFQAGKEDGPRDVSFLKIVWGAVFGPFAVAYNIFLRVEVPGDRILRVTGEGEDFVSGYIDGYRRGFKEQAVMYNVIGWASWILFAVISDSYDPGVTDYEFEPVHGF